MKALPLIYLTISSFASISSLRAEAPAFWKFAPVPPMGWNSYLAFGDSVTEEETMANARYMKEHLLSHGWNYVVIDFRWYDSVATYDDTKLTKERMGATLAADRFGRMLPAENRFPSAVNGQGFRPLADRIHGMGMKFGFHMMRGIPRQAVAARTPIEGSSFTAADAANTKSTCSWCPDMFGVADNEAGQAWYDSCARLWASWGLDFLKVDDLSHPYSAHEIAMLRKAIDKCGRPIVLSTSPGPTPVAMADHIKVNANMWRVSGDFWDEWKKLNHQFDLLAQWQGVGGPGHWPDADLIPFGHIGIRNLTPNTPNPCERWTRFTQDEQRTLITLLAVAPSPLMVAMNLPDNDDRTLALLTNDEVIAINQDPLGSQARRVKQQNGVEVWERNLSNGSRAVGLFNRGGQPAELTLHWADFGIEGSFMVRDLWRKTDLKGSENDYSCTLPPHGSELLKILPSLK